MKRRVLFCSPVMPESDREGGSKRIFDLITFLIQDGWEVTLSSRQCSSPRYIHQMQQLGVMVHVGEDAQVAPMIAAGNYDLAILAFWYVAEAHLAALQASSPKTRIIIDSIDLHFVRMSRRTFLNAEGPPARLSREYGDELVRELNSYVAADAVLAVSENEARTLNDLTGIASLARVVPLGEDLPKSVIPREERRGILFVGNFRHPPNLGAAEFLIRDIVPLLSPQLLEQHPVRIVGNGLPESVRKLGHATPGVTIVGWVPSVIPYLHQSAAIAVPLLYGAGTKLKMIQGLLSGTPVVSTDVGTEGLLIEDGRHALVANTASEFASCLTRLLSDSELWNRLSDSGSEHARTNFGLRSIHAAFRSIIADVFHQERPRRTRGAESAAALNPYSEMTRMMLENVVAKTRQGSIVAVVSKGDNELIRLDGRTGWHFPCSAGNRAYLGHHPADSAAAIRHLSDVQKAGADYLVVPSTYDWWLDHYTGFASQLYTNHSCVHQDADCRIFALSQST